MSNMYGNRKKQDESGPLLYHGSRDGLDGEIRPISRTKCEFGSGFYMSQDVNAAMAVVCTSQCPVIYTVRINFDKIGSDKCYHLIGKEWIYTVVAHRNKVPGFAENPDVQKVLNEISAYDILIGETVDDRIGPAVKAFENGLLTDEGLLHCLNAGRGNLQVVAKTEKACKNIVVIGERDLTDGEYIAAREWSTSMRDKGCEVLAEAKCDFANKRSYISELAPVNES